MGASWSADARSGADSPGATDAWLHGRRHGRRRQGIADVIVRPRLRENDPADGPVGQHERTTAVALVDHRPELEDRPADPLIAVDIAPVLDSLRGRADAIYVQTVPVMYTNRVRINTLALGARLPTFAGSRE